MQKILLATILIAASIAACSTSAPSPVPSPTAPRAATLVAPVSAPPSATPAASAPTIAPKNSGDDKGTVTVGSAPATIVASLTTACRPGSRTRFTPTVIGIVAAADRRPWTVPAEFAEGATAVDIFNDCTGNGETPNYMSQVKMIVIDEDGVEITGYLFADNYYELYVNGKFVARDSIGFTPFNSTVVRFKAKYPITYAVKLVDGETHPGIGLEYDTYNVGDGGFIAKFSDGTTTGAQWKVMPYYIAPLDDPGCVDVAKGRDASLCPDRPACADRNPAATCKALHFPVPENWTARNFDDSSWTPATLYKASEVTDQPGYMRYAQLFAPANFIWSRSLKLDNLVLARYTAQAPK